MTFKEVLTQVFRGSEKKKSLLLPTTFSHMDLMAVILLGFFVIFSTTPPFHCICRHIYMGSSVYCVLNLQRFMVTAVNLLSKSCSIVTIYGFKTSFAWELVGKLCGQIRHHSALYMEDSFIYLRWLYSIH